MTGTTASRSNRSLAHLDASSQENGSVSVGEEGHTDIELKAARFLLAFVVGTAAVLRLIGGNDQLWYDEIHTLIDSIRKPLSAIVSHFPSNNDHVFYSLLSHMSITLGGETPLTVRLPAILFGILSIPLIYTLGTKVTSRFEALAAALLATISAQHIWFSQNARGYTLLLVAALLGTQLILGGLKTRSKTPWMLFALVSALGAYTHLTMVLAVIGQAIPVVLYLLASRRFSVDEWKGPAIGFIGAAALTVLLYLPMIGDVAHFFGDSAAKAPYGASAGWAILELFRNLRMGFDNAAVLALGGAIFLAGVISYGRQSPLIVSLFFVPPAVVYLTSVLLDRPTFPRFFFFVAGFLLLVGVRGVFAIIHFALARMRGRWALWENPVRWLAVSAMTAVLLFDLSRSYLKPKMDYEGALAYVEAAHRPSDIVAFGEQGADYVYRQYYSRSWPRLMSSDDLANLRRNRDVVVLHTFDHFFQSSNPKLFEALETSCTEERHFKGTLGQGDIHVSRCPRRP